jgi:hypothetical protein
MNQLNEWTQLISKRLKSEAELVGVQAKHELYKDSAKETFIRVVLEQFLPDNFAVGTGRVIDSEGNKSSEQDIVIYRRDYPQLNLPGGTDIFLFESVLATIQVKTKLIRKTFFEALDQCASMADLQPVIDRPMLASIAAKNNFTLNQQNEYQHTDPLLNARFHLIGRPLSFVYAFNGYQTSLKQLTENIEMWIDYRRDRELPVDMKSCAAIIATQGCFAARNASPFSSKQDCLFGIGNDDAPVRLIIMQLMHALNRRLRKGSDNLGVKQGLDAYLNKIPLPKITDSIGKSCYAAQTAPLKSKQNVTDKTNRATKSTESTESLLNAKVSFSAPPPKSVAKPIAASTSKPVQPTRIKAPTGLGSGIQSTSSSSRAPEPKESPNGKGAFAETVHVPPSEQETDPLMQTQVMQVPKQQTDAESDPFLQTMQISKPESGTDPFSKTIPHLRN